MCECVCVVQVRPATVRLLRSVHYFNARRRRVSVVNNRIVRLPASAFFLGMTAAAAVWRPGGCRPSRRVHQVVLLVGDSKAAVSMTETDLVNSLSRF